MFTTIRKHQRWLMLVIAILTVVAFAFLYNTTDLERVGVNTVAKIYGRSVMQVDIEKALRNYQLAIALGQLDLVRDLAGAARSEDEAAENFIWNLMVLQHESAVLGIEPGVQAIVDRIKSLPVFQSNGTFDPLKYSAFMQEQLAPRGFSEQQLEFLVRDTLRLEGIRHLVGVPAVLFKGQVEMIRSRLAPLDVEVIRFSDTENVKTQEVSDEEVRAAFDAKRESLQMPEKRTVRYVAFVLPDSEREAKDKSRIEALQKLSSATGDFAQAMSDQSLSLEDAARVKGLEVRTTPLFAKNGASSETLSDLDKDIVTSAADVAFRLPSVGALEIAQLSNEGYVVMELASVEHGRPLTFEEAQADLRANLVAAKREHEEQAAAEKALSTIREQLAAGKPLNEAAQAAGAKVESFKGLSILSADFAVEQRQVLAAALDLSVGSLGQFIPQPEGGFAVYLAARGEPDATLLAQQMPMIENSLLREKQMLMFAQWLVTARQASGLQILRRAM